MQEFIHRISELVKTPFSFTRKNLEVIMDSEAAAEAEKEWDACKFPVPRGSFDAMITMPAGTIVKVLFNPDTFPQYRDAMYARLKNEVTVAMHNRQAEFWPVWNSGIIGKEVSLFVQVKEEYVEDP